MKNNTEQPVSHDLSYLSPDICHRCSRAFRPGNQRVSLARGSGVLHAAGGGFLI